MLSKDVQNITVIKSKMHHMTNLFLLFIPKTKTEQEKALSFFADCYRISLNPGCTDICPVKCFIKGSKWERLGLIAYATPVMVNLLGPQGSDASSLCNALITTRHHQHWACSLPLTHPIPQEYFCILCSKRAVICSCMAVG